MVKYKLYTLEETTLQDSGLTLEPARYRYGLPDSFDSEAEALEHAAEHGPHYRDVVVLASQYVHPKEN